MYALLKSILLVGVSCLVLGVQAIAHGDLASATPAINGIVEVPPTKLELRFSDDLNVKFSGVKIIGPANAVVDTGVVTFPRATLLCHVSKLSFPVDK